VDGDTDSEGADDGCAVLGKGEGAPLGETDGRREGTELGSTDGFEVGSGTVGAAEG